MRRTATPRPLAAPSTVVSTKTTAAAHRRDRRAAAASSAASITFVFGGFTTAGNEDVDAIAFAGTYDANGRR